MYQPALHKNRYGVPILYKTDMDIIAENYLQDFNPDILKNPMETDIDAFAEFYLGLQPDYQFLSHNGVYLGMMVFNDTAKIPVYVPQTNRAEYISAKARTVIIDKRLLEEEQSTRYRFTMGHECCHDILHSGYYAFDPNQLSFFATEPMIQCRRMRLNSKERPLQKWSHEQWMEWQANYMSSSLLMPKSMVYKLAGQTPVTSRLFRTATLVHETSKVFHVSHQAALYRLQGLGVVGTQNISIDIFATDPV